MFSAMHSGVKKVKSLEKLIKEAPIFSSQQNSYSDTPHEVSTLGSDNRKQMNNAHEDIYQRDSTPFKSSHFENILHTQRHNEIVNQLDGQESLLTKILSKIQQLELLHNDTEAKMLSLESTLLLFSQSQKEENAIILSLLQKLSNNSDIKLVKRKIEHEMDNVSKRPKRSAKESEEGEAKDRLATLGLMDRKERDSEIASDITWSPQIVGDSQHTERTPEDLIFQGI